MTDRQAAALASLREQGYTETHSARVARTWYPTPAQERMAQARAARAAKNGATAVVTTSSTATTSAAPAAASSPAANVTVVTSRFTPEGLERMREATRVSSRAKWARVRKLGLRSLSELKRYDELKATLEGAS